MANNGLRSAINLLSDKNIATIHPDEAGYNYYGFVAKDGSWTILRENLDNTEYLYAVGSSNFSTADTNRASLSYQLPSAFPRA